MLLEKGRPLDQMNKSNLWLLYGRSASGKTTLAATFPRPIAYLAVGDDGYASIEDPKGITYFKVENFTEFTIYIQELLKDKTFKTVIVDTFSLFVNEWTLDLIKRGKGGRANGAGLSQSDWGDLGTNVNSLIRDLKNLAVNKNVVLTAHEVDDSFSGLDSELLPEIRPNFNKSSRSYMEGMANYGIHCAVLQKEGKDGKVITKHIAHIAPHPYYWVKFQKPASVKLPKMLADPTYDKIMALLKGEKPDE